MIPTSLAIRGEDGAFRGVVTATMDYAGFIRGLRDQLDEEGQVLALFDRSGAMLAGAHRADPVGMEASARALWPDAKGWLSIDDAQARLTAYHEAPRTSVIVAISTPRDEALREWRGWVLAGSIAYAFLVSLLTFAAMPLIRQMRAQRRPSLALAAANDQKIRLFSVIAHDLRSPFNAVLGFAGRLASAADGAPRETLKDDARHLEDAARKLAAVCENVLVWGRQQLDDMPPRLAQVDLAALVDRAVEPLRFAAELKGVALTTRLGPPLTRTNDPFNWRCETLLRTR